MDFNVVDLVLRVQSSDGSALVRSLCSSGADFAAACRNVVCQRPGIECRLCVGSGECGWYQVFAQELATDPEALRRHQKPPLPFVFSCPLNAGENGPGILVFELVVVGSAIPFLDMLLQGFSSLLRQRGGELIEVSSRGYQGEESFLGAGTQSEQLGNLVVLSASGILESRSWGGESLVIRLHSPLRLVSEGRQQRRFEFGIFARNLLRRVSAMAHYYGQCRLDHDFRALARMAEEVVCDEYRFFWGGGGGKVSMGGLSGYGSFSGSFAELLPFLTIGRYLHAGKGASFGFGAFDIEVV